MTKKLMEAIKACDLKAVKNLLDVDKANVNMQEASSGRTPLMQAVFFSSPPIEQWVALVQLLFDCGANRYLTDHDQNTVIDYCLDHPRRLEPIDAKIVIAILDFKEGVHERIKNDKSGSPQVSKPLRDKNKSVLPDAPRRTFQSSLSALFQPLVKNRSRVDNPDIELKKPTEKNLEFVPFSLDDFSKTKTRAVPAALPREHRSGLQEPLLSRENIESEVENEADNPKSKSEKVSALTIFQPLQLGGPTLSTPKKDDHCLQLKCAIL